MLKKKSIILVFMVLSTALFCVLYLNYINSKFSSEKWKNNFDYREKIINTLFTQYDLRGMNRKAVYKLLGDPLPKSKYPSSIGVIVQDETNKELYGLEEDNSIIVYPFSSKIEAYNMRALCIKFNKNEKIDEFSIIFFRT